MKGENGTEGRRPEGLKANVAETPQATNEMQEADLENAEKGEKGQKSVEPVASVNVSLSLASAGGWPRRLVRWRRN